MRQISDLKKLLLEETDMGVETSRNSSLILEEGSVLKGCHVARLFAPSLKLNFLEIAWSCR